MTDINAMCDSSQAFVGERIAKALSFHLAGATGQQDGTKWEIPMELMDIDEVQTAPKTELAPIERAAIALESSKTEQHLKALATKHQSITVVKDKAGREQAHGAYMELMRARTTVEKASKEAREDATKFSKAVIAEAARLVAIVEPEEARLKEARDAWDAEQARIKAEAEARERARVLAITERIAAIKAYVVMANNCRTSARVAELQVKLSATEMTGFEEFEREACDAMLATQLHLAKVFSDRQADEVEAARIKADQEAEAARLKADQERIKAEQKAEAEKLAYERKLMEEERAAIQAELDAKAEKQRKEMEAKRAAAQAEARRAADALAAERAELERKLAEILEAKSKPVEPDVCVVIAPESTMFAELSAPVGQMPIAPLIAGELGVIDCDVVMPPAVSIVIAVAEFWHTDNKTAARWITERAAEIESLQ